MGVSEIIYVTEFKNQFDEYQVLHATRSKEKAHNDAGASGRVIELVRKSALDEAQREISRLKVQLEKEQSDCLSLIDERNFREDQINKIADTLGDRREWSNINDRGDNCIEAVWSLKDKLTTANALLDETMKELREIAKERFAGDDVVDRMWKRAHNTAAKIEQHSGGK
jgi:flagellar biosynthesis chaperone FliJ